MDDCRKILHCNRFAAARIKPLVKITNKYNSLENILFFGMNYAYLKVRTARMWLGSQQSCLTLIYVLAVQAQGDI